MDVIKQALSAAMRMVQPLPGMMTSMMRAGGGAAGGGSA
jgi:hypothetical protein